MKLHFFRKVERCASLQFPCQLQQRVSPYAVFFLDNYAAWKSLHVVRPETDHPFANQDSFHHNFHSSMSECRRRYQQTRIRRTKLKQSTCSPIQYLSISDPSIRISRIFVRGYGLQHLAFRSPQECGWRTGSLQQANTSRHNILRTRMVRHDGRCALLGFEQAAGRSDQPSSCALVAETAPEG